jgi:serine/threonine protein kinase
MYQDQILIVLGVVTFVLFLLLILYLVITQKQGKLFHIILKQSTETFDVMTVVTKTTSHKEQAVIETELMNTLPKTKQLIRNKETELMMSSKNTLKLHPSHVETVQSSPFLSLSPVEDFDASVLKEQYTLLGELGGGGMSRVFLARKHNTENEWIIKFVPSCYGSLTDNEAGILKTLNHSSLPKIIDIFTDEQGLYLVMSYIEGVGLNRVLEVTDNVSEFRVSHWAEELTQVLVYLHEENPRPVFHLDLKPSNIIVTRDNRWMLIDFGISRHGVLSAHVEAATLEYAAPEQFKGSFSEEGSNVIQRRFGELPNEREFWSLDGRTDIYSLGVVLFEATVGQTPTPRNMNLLAHNVSPGLCKIIHKCLALRPEERYQTATELLGDIQHHIQYAKPKMVQTVFLRKVAKLASVASVALAVFGFTFGTHLMQQVAQAAVSITPELMMVSLQQHSDLSITSLRPNGELQHLYGGQLRWEPTVSYVAQVEGNRVIGLNVGETQINGWFRMHEISMYVNVVEPMNGIVDISMRFRPGMHVNLYAGMAYRMRVDGGIRQMNFVIPSSMDITDDGTMYIVDAGFLRRINNGIATTVYIDPFYLRPHMVRTYGNEVFILTQSWWGDNDDDYFYGIFRYTNGLMEELYIGDGWVTTIRDFFVQNGQLYFIQRNDVAGATYLRSLTLRNPDNVTTIIEVSPSASTLTTCGTRIYLADAEKGIFQVYENGRLTHLAGSPEEQAFIDGHAPLFYRPTRIRYFNNALYVWDFNVLRKILLEDGIAQESISLAGMASPTFDMTFYHNEQAERIIFPYSVLTDFIPSDDGVLMTDPRRGLIWQIDVN